MISWVLAAYRALKTAASVPAWLPWFLLALVVGLVGSHVGAYRHGYSNGAATVDAVLQRERAEAATAALSAEQQLKAAQERLDYELMLVASEAWIREQDLRADFTAAASAGERLQRRIERLAATCDARIEDTTATILGEAADASGRMLAHMLRRMDEHARRAIAFGDTAHARGLACEQQYDALEHASNGRGH